MHKRLFVVALILSTQVSCTKFFQSDESMFISACEDEIKERSNSPSTVKLIKTVYLAKELTLEKYMEINPDSSFVTQEAIKYGSLKPIQYWAKIRFEQANVFGSPRLHVAECSYISSRGIDALGEEIKRYSSLKVNGKTRQELTLEYVLKNRT